MPKLLVLFSSGEGQTADIAQRIADTIGHRRCDVEVCDVAQFGPERSVADYTGVIVGGSVHNGKHAPRLTKFVAERRNELNSRPSAFFSVSLAAAGTEDQRQDAERYLRQFLERADWQPRMTAKFAGAVRYLEYGFLKRWMMKSIMKRAGRDTDTTRNHEYTDWDEVDQFATAFAQQCSTLDHDFRESVSAAAE